MGLGFVLVFWMVFLGCAGLPVAGGLAYWSWRNGRLRGAPSRGRALAAALFPFVLIAVGLVWFFGYAAYSWSVRFCMIDVTNQGYLMKDGCSGSPPVNDIRELAQGCNRWFQRSVSMVRQPTQLLLRTKGRHERDGASGRSAFAPELKEGLTMPMLDITVPEGALKPEAEDAPLAKLTDLLLRHEGVDPQNPAARSVAWVFLHRPARLFVGGTPAQAPQYRVAACASRGAVRRRPAHRHGRG